MSAKRPRISATASALKAMPLEQKRKNYLDADPLQLAAEMFRPRTTDSFERWAREKVGTWLNPAQRLVNDSIMRNRYTAVPSAHAQGKALVNGTLIPTPSGKIPIEQLAIGDFVFGADGRITKVTGVYPQGIRDTYRLRTNDEVETLCSGDHLWQVNRWSSKPTRKATEIRTTEELLFDGLYYIPGRNRNQKPRFTIPMCAPVTYPVVNLPIDPYILGVWIGDGTIGQNSRDERVLIPSFSCWDPEIAQEVARRLPCGYRLTVSKSGHRYHIRNTNTSGFRRDKGERSDNFLRDSLIAYGLNVKSPERFIPPAYLYGSVRQRVELLRGLMDTDGASGKNVSTRCSYWSNSLRLALDVQELVRSLGGTAKLNGPNARTKTYRVDMRISGGNPFYLPRKRAKWSNDSQSEASRRYGDKIERQIVSISPIGRFAQTCISVEASDGLFLADGFIITHNSFFAASKTGHWIDSHTLGNAFVVTTAPTSAQIESVLWRELHRVHAKAELRGRLTRSGYPQWRVGDELVAYGRRPTEIAAFQGLHARYVLLIIDEADGVSEQLFTAVDTLASSGHVRVLAIGNPDSSESHFARICRPGSGWNVVSLDGLRSPNFTRRGVSPFPELKQYMIDNDIPFADESVAHVPATIRAEWRELLLSPEWVYERMTRWGVNRSEEDQPDGSTKVRWAEPALWLSKVRGRSPTEGSEGIIPLAWVELAIRRWEEWDANGRPPLEGRFIFGADVADSGKDETVVSRRKGYCIIDFVRTPMQDTDTTAKRLARRLRSNPDSTSCVDGSGIGAGVVNQIRGLHLPVIAFIGAAKPEGIYDLTGEFTFANVRTAAYWRLRELLDPVNSTVKVMLPPDEDMKTDLTIPTWGVKAGAVIAMETKESVQKRLKRSPDVGDTTAISFWPNVMGSQKVTLREYGTLGSGADEWAPDPEFNDMTEPFAVSARQRREKRALRDGDSGVAERDRRRKHVYAYSRPSMWGEEDFLG